LKKKSGLKVLKLKKRRLKPINSLLKSKFKRKKFKFKTTRQKLKLTSVVLSRRMCNQRKQLLKKNSKPPDPWSSRPKKP
jgi:hypothetical protein